MMEEGKDGKEKGRERGFALFFLRAERSTGVSGNGDDIDRWLNTEASLQISASSSGGGGSL